MPNTTDPHILLCGGGFVLNRLATVLPQDSFVITSRSGEKVADWKSRGYVAEVLDIAVVNDVEALFLKYPSITTLVDSVPPIRSNGASTEDPYIGVRNLRSQEALRQIIYLSSTAVYGEDSGGWVTEETVPEPATQSGEHRLQSENLYRESSASVTALRLSGIYGPGRGLGIALKEGRYRMLEDIDRHANRIHVDDIVQTLHILLTASGLEAAPTYNVSDDAPTPVSEVVQYYIEKFSLPAPKTLTFQEARAAGRERLISSNKRVSNARLKTLPGFKLRYPSYREGAGTEFYND